MQGGPQVWPAEVPGYEPAFVWPADHAWCVANDVDPHWAGIGGGAPLIELLVADPCLDAVAADPAGDQPLSLTASRPERPHDEVWPASESFAPSPLRQ